MHYWFVEAEYNASSSPVLLWFNGGPGASSLFGLLVELGPFLLNDISRQSPLYEETGIPQLIYNEYGWQKAANILALSMPPPIGFSYCDPPGPSATGDDCGPWNDTSTAQVTYQAIKSWYTLFPEYKSNEMYIAGESYAGVYVPMIVKEILANPDDSINLKGFAVGDACTPPDICGSKVSGPYWNIEFLYGKSAFSNRLYEEIQDVCSQQELIEGGLSDECSAKVDQIDDEVGGYWIYGYYDDCWYENDIRRKLVSKANDQQYWGPPIIPYIKGYSHRKSMAGPSPYNKINGYACGGPGAQIEWLGRPEVISALNLPSDVNFFQSDNGVGFTYELTEDDLVSWYKDIISQNKLRILVYNGDTDPCINAFQAQNWTRNLGFAEVESWRPWTLDGCQRMGGYVTRYENNFDFLTIKGSGHMVPQNKGRAALSFLKTFLQNTEYLEYDSSCSQPSKGMERMDFGPPIDLMTEDQILSELEYEKEMYSNKISYLEKKLREIEGK